MGRLMNRLLTYSYSGSVPRGEWAAGTAPAGVRRRPSSLSGTQRRDPDPALTQNED